MNMAQHIQLARLAKFTGFIMLLAYAVILLGAATRVWDAGMSCPDWPKCYGVWVPFPESHVLPHTPEGYVVDGAHYTMFQVFLEWSHRLLASIVGGFVIILLIGILKLKAHRPSKALGLVIAALTVLAVQIKLGGLTVFLENIHWSVALHLGGAMTFFALLTAARYRLAQGARQSLLPPPHLPLVTHYSYFAFATLVLITMLMGAIISSAHAGGVCGGLPVCSGQMWPEDTLQRWHMLHRFLALAVFAVSTLLIKISRHTPLRPAAAALHIVVWGQVLLGIATLYSFSHYPDYYRVLSLAHLAWGAVLWLISVGVICRLTLGEGGRAHA